MDRHKQRHNNPSIADIEQNLEKIEKTLAQIMALKAEMIPEGETECVKKLRTSLAQIQQAGDRLISRMSQADRLHFKKEMPAALALLGWADRIDDDGHIICDA